jgi:ribosome-associated toxin RatA of RatAB toxin-antitoxin module
VYGLAEPGRRLILAVRFLAWVLVLLAPAESRAADWETLSQKDGMLVERRGVDGSPVQEVRVTAHTWLAPGDVFDTIWRQRDYPQFVPYLKRLDIIAESGDERIVYEQVALPFVRDRDYTVRVRRQMDPAAQRYEMAFASTDDLAPPLNVAYVRIRDIFGSWRVELDGAGRGSVLRYTVRSDPGGMIPAWVANKAQGDAAANLVRAMIRRAAERHGPEFRDPTKR